MKKIFLSVLVLFSIFSVSYAKNIDNIQDELTEYPVRSNALVVVLQPVPDNSGDYTMTLCNKQGHCRQTSMQYNEIRYIGLFLEDAMPALKIELNKSISSVEQWKKSRDEFASFYANYMNTYDSQYGTLKNLFRLQKK